LPVHNRIERINYFSYQPGEKVVNGKIFIGICVERVFFFLLIRYKEGFGSKMTSMLATWRKIIVMTEKLEGEAP